MEELLTLYLLTHQNSSSGSSEENNSGNNKQIEYKHSLTISVDGNYNILYYVINGKADAYTELNDELKEAILCNGSQFKWENEESGPILFMEADDNGSAAFSLWKLQYTGSNSFEWLFVNSNLSLVEDEVIAL